MKILLIEDDENQRNLLKGFLEKNAFTVITSIDGAEGILEFKKTLVDLVVTDFKMPKKMGWKYSGK